MKSRSLQALGVAIFAASLAASGPSARGGVPAPPRFAQAPSTGLAVASRLFPDPSDARNKGAGAEYVEYQAPFHFRNQFIVGGLVACAALLMGTLLMLERRSRLVGIALACSGVVAGALLMISDHV